MLKKRKPVKAKGAEDWQQELCLRDSFIEITRQLQNGGVDKQPITINEELLQINWARLLDNSTTTQSVENNRTSDASEQLMISKQVTIEKDFRRILMDISKQVLDTKYTLNLGQLLQVILNMKCYILNPIPSKLVLPKPVVASVAIDHQMVVI